MNEMPVFVKVEDFKEALDLMNMIRAKIENAKHTLEKINQLRGEEAAELELWQETIDEAERKIEFIDKTLSDPNAL